MNIQSRGIIDLFSIRNKVALVTGGSRGIGFMIAKAYVESGAKVYITSRTVKECRQAAGTLSQIGHCVAIPSDVATKEGRESIFSVLQEKEGVLDILVNNAGIALGGDPELGFEGFPEESFDQVMAVNAKAPFLLTQKLIGLLGKNASQMDPARIINIGSAAGIKVSVINDSGAGSYGPSKALLHFMTKEWAVNFAARHITANAIAPGLFPSNMTGDAEFHKKVAAICPIQRIGNAEDMAGIAIFLASRASAFMTGEVIRVDGGYTLL